jgi:serine/threonine protein kinase
MVNKPRFGHYLVDDGSIYGIDRDGGYRTGAYAATDPAGRLVRLELLPFGSISAAQKLRKFADHLNAVAEHSHNLIPIEEVGAEGKQLFTIRRWVQGISLSDLLAKKKMAPEQAVKITENIADIVDSAHRNNLTLGSVNTQNIFLTDDRSIYLLPNLGFDFPLPRDANMPTEILLGEEVSPSTDVYLLAAVLYEMLTGTRPFQNLGRTLAVNRGIAWELDHAAELPVTVTRFNPAIPKRMDEVLARGLAKDPASRYSSAKTFALAARRALETRIPLQPTCRPSINPVVLWIMRHLPRHFQGKSWQSRSASIELRAEELKAQVRANGASKDDPLSGLSDLLERRRMGLALLSTDVRITGTDDGET